MTNEKRLAARRERLQNRRPRAAISFSDYAVAGSEDPEFGWDFDGYYLQIANTIGLYHFDHPEIEALISFHMDLTGHSIVTYLADAVRDGARYAPGDRVEVPGPFPWNRHTVEFRAFTNARGTYLRAVVLDLEEEFQSLPTDEAYNWLTAYGPLIDPCEHL